MRKLFFLTLLLVLFSACEEKFNRTHLRLNLNVKHSSMLNHVVASGAVVSLKHSQKNSVAYGETNNNGDISFANLDPGFYNLLVVQTLLPEDVEDLSNLNITDSLLFNATANIELLADMSDSIVLTPAFSSKLIIREFYYSGSTMASGDNYLADQYLEIYNNSNMPQSINGLLILEHESYGNGFNPWANIKDSVVIKSIWQIPENTQKNMLLPGKSIVIARDAINHKDDENGNPLSPVNLGKADFEFYVEGTENKDLDSEAENLKEIYSAYRGTDVTFHSRNGGGLLIAESKAHDIEAYVLTHRVKKYNVTGSSFKYFVVIPNGWVLDAIDVLKDENSVLFKRFSDDLDAGFTYNITSGSATCISRRLVSDVNGVKRFMDTNNSSVDFLINQIPKPFLND